MSRNALIVEKETPDKSPQVKRRRAEFRGLIHRLFHGNSTAALVGSGVETRTSEACRGLAGELAAAGNRVVIVDVDRMLHANPLPAATACSPGRASNIWLWPATTDASVKPVHSVPASPAESDWMGSLRHDFDAVLLDCPALETEPGAAEIAARADAAVLVVEAGQTKKQQIRQDERALERRGVKLAGCILMRRR
jgi:Mrp family chromosome partitioning ATPase